MNHELKVTLYGGSHKKADGVAKTIHDLLRGGQEAYIPEGDGWSVYSVERTTPDDEPESLIIHFGVRNLNLDESEPHLPKVYGHGRNTEWMDEAGMAFPVMIGSGSWANWDEPALRDYTLHVVVDRQSQEIDARDIEWLRDKVKANLSRGTELIPYMIVTTRSDWSDIQGVATYDGEKVALFPSQSSADSMISIVERPF